MDEYANGISDQIEDLDSRMSTVIQKQADARQKATEDVAEMKEAVLQLFSKISDVKSKASQSEVRISIFLALDSDISIDWGGGERASLIYTVVPLSRLESPPILLLDLKLLIILCFHFRLIPCVKEMVQETIHDIRMLHTAKHNLQTTVTALRRLHMLIAAVRQLELASQERRFREAANLLDAVQQLLTHFDSYSSVPRIADLRAVQYYLYTCPSLTSYDSVAAHTAFRFTRQTVASVKSSLTDDVQTAFETVGHHLASSTDPQKDYDVYVQLLIHYAII